MANSATIVSIGQSTLDKFVSELDEFSYHHFNYPIGGFRLD